MPHIFSVSGGACNPEKSRELKACSGLNAGGSLGSVPYGKPYWRP